MKLIDLYRLQYAEVPAAEKARALLKQSHWLAFNAEFDPKTGEALPQALSGLLEKLTRKDTVSIKHDRLWHITNHARPSVDRLLRSLNESPRREHALMPVHAVRELDANSFIKLSNRPGRNIREKLAGKPYMQAVRRYQSGNLLENRLLKAFVIHLAELLELRRDYLHEEEDELVARIHSWLRGDEAQSIACWDNLPPNNTLLSHRDYRRIWDAWRWMQSLDDDIANDLANFESRADTMREWQDRASVYLAGMQLFADQPVLFGYNSFSIRPWSAPIQIRETARKVVRSKGITEIHEPVCVDLVNPRPRYATASQAYGALPDIYLWQQWHDGKEAVDLGLFRSDAAFLHADATSVALSDLFFNGKQTNDLMHRAARSFASKMRECFKNDSLVWLVPDSVNDFEIEILRCHLNSHFSCADPLPRSVAAVFEQVDYSGIKKEGFTVVVVDSIGGRNCATKLIAKFDPELKKRLPETKGNYWERCPPVTLSNSDQRAVHHAEPQHFDLLTFDSAGGWHDPEPTKNHQTISPKVLKEDPRIGPFDSLIDLKKSPVAGGARLRSLQLQAAGIPLWRDKMPELSIKVFINGSYKRFYLVSRKTPPVKPIRGQPISIQVAEEFKLPAGKKDYKLPLSVGENADELGFSARLDSPSFPLKEDTACKLSLTFEYGADEPYKLIFAPLNKSFPPVRATWERTKENNDDAAAPEYPEPLSWDELCYWRDAQGDKVDLLEWMIDSLTRLSEYIPNRCMIKISSLWKSKEDNDGVEYWFAFANNVDGKRCYCSTKNFAESIDGNPNDNFPSGTELYCDIRTMRSGVSAIDISMDNDVVWSVSSRKRIISFKERSLLNRMSLIWSDARSLNDLECPVQFKDDFNDLTLLLLERLPSEIIERKILFLFSCLHKDAPEVCIQWIQKQVGIGKIRNAKAVGFALGDVSQVWQKELFANIWRCDPNDAQRVFAYAIWRWPHFVEKFSLEEFESVFDELRMMLSKIKKCPPKNDAKDKWTVRNWVRATAEPLELLLGLLRTRASTDPEIKRLLQPHQKITKELAKQVERVTEIVEQANVNLFSRVQINVTKPEGDRTPDLLYALRLYLTGDDGANAIHITSISDSDDD